MKHTLLFLISLFFAIGMEAQNDSIDTDTLPKGTWSLSLGGNVGYFLHNGPDIQQILHAYNVSYYDLRAKWQAAPSPQANAYDRALNYPRLQIGLMYGDMNRLEIYRPKTPYHSRIGYLLTLYGGIQVDFWKSGRWSAGIDLQNGIGYCPHPYDVNNNDDQWIIGSRLNIFVNLGAFVRYQLSPRWALTANLDFKHYSNGTLDRPNFGVNSVGPSLAVEWTIPRQNRTLPPAPPCKGGEYNDLPDGVTTPLPRREGQGGESAFYVEAVAGLGMRALNDANIVNHTSHHSIYAYPTVLIAPMWRWHLLHATGLGIDYSYLDYVYTIQNFDEILEARGKPHTPRHGYSPHVLGLSLRHEIFYKQMSVNVALGWNVFKRLGYTSELEERWLYQHVGLRYSLPFTSNRLFVGFNIKAHRFGKVDSVQLITGWRIGK